MTSEVKVKVEAEVKIEVRHYKGMARPIRVQNIRVITSKILSYGYFKLLTSEVEVKVEAEVKINVRLE